MIIETTEDREVYAGITLDGAALLGFAASQAPEHFMAADLVGLFGRIGM